MRVSIARENVHGTQVRVLSPTFASENRKNEKDKARDDNGKRRTHNMKRFIC